MFASQHQVDINGEHLYGDNNFKIDNTDAGYYSNAGVRHDLVPGASPDYLPPGGVDFGSTYYPNPSSNPYITGEKGVYIPMMVLDYWAGRTGRMSPTSTLSDIREDGTYENYIKFNYAGYSDFFADASQNNQIKDGIHGCQMQPLPK